MKKIEYLIPLSAEEIHLWVFSMDEAIAYIEYCQSILSDFEKEKAESFLSSIHKRKYILSRAVLRMILAKYISTKEKDIIFNLGYGNKPFILEKQNTSEIVFNASYSNNIAVYAITRNRNVGVDVEYIRQIEDLQEMAEDILTDKEIVEYNQNADHQKTEIFYKYWTHKEAYLKSTGEGLSTDMSLIEFSSDANNKLNLKSVHSNPIKNDHWFISEIQISPNYKTAIVVKKNRKYINPILKINSFRFPNPA